MRPPRTIEICNGNNCYYAFKKNDWWIFVKNKIFCKNCFAKKKSKPVKVRKFYQR